MDYYHNNSYNRAHSDNASVTKNAKKKKATKGAVAAPVKLSTDPQSVAARERRHRISEKFKTLQSLVPGGAKMDTVSMLDEAIHYVKFLKTQIWLHETLISGDQCISEYHQSLNNSVIPAAADAYSDQSSFQPQHQELQCCSESFEWSQCCLSSVDAAASGGGGGQSSWVFDMPEVQFGSEMSQMTMF